MHLKTVFQKINLEQIMFVFALLMVFGMPWSRVFFQLGLYGLIGCFALSGRWREKFSTVRDSKVFLSAAALSLLAIISLSYTTAPMNLAWVDVSRYLKLLMVGTMMFALDSRKKRLGVLAALAAGIAVLMLPTLLDGSGLAATLDLPIKQFANQAYSAQHTAKGFGNLVYWKNQIAHGFFVAILCFMCLCCAVQWKRYRLPLVLLAAICVIDIVFFIYGRMALLSLAASLLLFALLQVRSLKVRLLTLTGILVLFAVAYLSLDVVNQRIETIVTETRGYYQDNNSATSAGIRLHYWNISLQLFNESRFLGAGAGGFRHFLETRQDQFLNQNHSHTHNEYLTALAQYGLIGLAALVAMLVLALRHASKVDDRVERHCYQGILVIFALGCLSDSMLYNQDEGWTLVFVLALIAAATSKTLAEPKATPPPASSPQGLTTTRPAPEEEKTK